MTSVNQKTNQYEPAVPFEDGESPPCAAPRQQQTDSFEAAPADPRRDELQRLTGERARLAPRLEEKQTEALRSLPKLFPMAGTPAAVAFALWDAAHGQAGKAALDAGRAMAETKAFNEAGREAMARFGQAAGEGVEGLAKLKDAYEVYRALREYGALVRQDEALRHRAEDLQMQLDPKAKFELVSVNGQRFYRQEGRLHSDQPRAEPTQEELERLEDLRRRHGLR